MKYTPHTSEDVKKMLEVIGVESVDDLFKDIPQNKRIDKLGLPNGLSEKELVDRFTRMAYRNRSFYDRACFLGAGAYRHFSPAVVDAIISRSEFYTAYTPYQAEASQGILQSIFEFQTLMARITGMDIANASLYDGSTACAEAVNMAISQTKKGEVLYSEGLHPEYEEVLHTYFKYHPKVVLKKVPLKEGTLDLDTLEKMVSKNTACLILQSPNCLGFIENTTSIGKVLKKKNSKSMYIVAVLEPLSLGILKSPGECGADIVIGEAAGLGLPPSYGGPYVGFLATKSRFLRKIPGRLVGLTTDADGKRAFCLTLQAREQHIRREKASSNICTNQALCALAVTVYLSYIGKTGFYQLAYQNTEKAHYLAEKLKKKNNFKLIYHKPFFNEFTVECPDDPYKIERFLYKHGIIGGFPTGRWRSKWKNYMTFCVTEMNDKAQIDDLVGFLDAYCEEVKKCITF